jgi:hypothetical protein
MNSRWLRVALASVLIATVVARVWASNPTTEVDIRAAVLALIARQGWSAYDEAAGSADALGKAIYFRAPECQASGRVFAVDLGLQLAPMLEHVIGPGHGRHFVYMGRTWSNPDRFGMRLEWLKNRALSLFGLGRYVGSEIALLIAEPQGCRAAENVNWSAVWERQTAPPLHRSL